MTHLERQIRTAQHRLWLNRWLRGLSGSLAIAAAVFAAIVLIQRLFDVLMPLLWISIGLGAGAILASMLWTVASREDASFAAAKLDDAAGLRERLSSGRYCRSADDPFARAVVADAERVSTSLSARQHIRLTMPQPGALTVASIVVAMLMFLVPAGLLKRSEATETREQTAQLEQAKVAVKRKMDRVRKMVEATPALEDLKADLEGLDKGAGGKLHRPADIRHDAVKKIDKLADAIKQKRKTGDYEAAKEMRKMLRGLKVPELSDAPTQKLVRSLAQGDFKTAKEEIKAIREQLATLKSEQDKELVAKLSKQLDDLAKQLEKLSRNEKLTQKLVQAGLKKEDLQRMLENLTKKDLDQLKKQLEKKGMSQQQIEKIVKQLQQRRQAGDMAKKLAQSMKQGAMCDNPGQTGAAIAGLTMAGDQLSELEQLEQEMSQLDSVLADLQSSRDSIDRPCSACNGQGCSLCQGNRPGGGMGRLGQGRGGLAPEEATTVGFKVERGKVHTGKGAIIGQFLFDGEQVKGDVSSEFSEVVTAAEHDATDRINRNRIPRQYHKAVKAYFSNVQRSIKGKGATLRKSDKAAKTPDSNITDESADQTRDNKEKD
ncbi:MAG: hypothetical protein WBE26_19225 [Phycisphaerae bacterium]